MAGVRRFETSPLRKDRSFAVGLANGSNRSEAALWFGNQAFDLIHLPVLAGSLESAQASPRARESEPARPEKHVQARRGHNDLSILSKSRYRRSLDLGKA